MSAVTSNSASQEWACKAQGELNRETIVGFLRAMVDVPSPTGEEGPLARSICQQLDSVGLESHEQVIDSSQSNAVGVLPGTGGGKSLLLYSPIDTVTSNSAEEDLPWLASELRDDMRAQSWSDDDHVFGLGAQNPKGHAACVLAAGAALKAANVPLAGDVLLGFGAGGMPTNAREGMRKDSGHGAGCTHMVKQLSPIDSAIIAKSGWSVSWEEVGFVWITVRVKGIHNYVGSRHLLPFVNPINQAGRLIERLDTWFGEWAETHRSGLVAPQGVVSHIESGWERMPAFTPAECRFQIDLRLSPRTSAAQVDEQFGKAFERMCQELNIEATWERTVHIPGTTTSPEQDIIKHSINAWETITGREHQPAKGMSGATDANILRAAGIPTARVGLGKADIPDIDFALGMNAAVIDDLMQLSKFLIQVAVDQCLVAESAPGARV